jgi:Uma2 family endonuclease
MDPRDWPPITLEQYIALDSGREGRWEWADGRVRPVFGAGLEHGVVSRNLLVALTTRLRGKPCLPLPDGAKVSTPATRAYHYPDVVVVCGKIQRDAKIGDAVTNPSVLAEVLSPSTEDYDRGGKLSHYRSLESLREYLLVSIETRTIEHHRRIEPDQWLVTLVRNGQLTLPTLDLRIPVDEFWVDLDRVAR